MFGENPIKGAIHLNLNEHNILDIEAWTKLFFSSSSIILAYFDLDILLIENLITKYPPVP